MNVTGPVKCTCNFFDPGILFLTEILANTLLLSKYHAATRAHVLLEDECFPLHISKLCHCKLEAKESTQTTDENPHVDPVGTHPLEVDQPTTKDGVGESIIEAALVKLERDPEAVTQKEVSDETTEGFAIRSQILTRLYGDLDANTDNANVEDESDEVLDELVPFQEDM